MSTLEEIEQAVCQLAPEDLAAFRVWFAEFDATIWDRELEEDVEAGCLDALAEEALQELREGRCTNSSVEGTDVSTPFSHDPCASAPRA